MRIIPYIFFGGDAAEALAFYAAAGLGEVVDVSRYKDAPPGMAPPSGPDHADWIMNASIARDGTPVLMASDGRNTDRRGPMKRATLSIALDDPAEARRLFGALADGGSVTMPLQRTFWGAEFGMFTDRFGIDWMVNCAPPAK